MSERIPYPDLSIGADETLCDISHGFSRFTRYIPLKLIDFFLRVVAHVREYRQRAFTVCFLHHEHVDGLGLLYLSGFLGRLIWFDSALHEATLDSSDVPAELGPIFQVFPLLVYQDSLEVGAERTVLLEGGCELISVGAIAPLFDQFGELSIIITSECDIPPCEWIVVSWFLWNLEKPEYILRPLKTTMNWFVLRF